uniref:Uncharacterized protein n=1 Tax=Medicago truncatula TaxID=3880 RepID=I3SUH3_MEDTR|nr:unknown [Medicago truncatula]
MCSVMIGHIAFVQMGRLLLKWRRRMRKDSMVVSLRVSSVWEARIWGSRIFVVVEVDRRCLMSIHKLPVKEKEGFVQPKPGEEYISKLVVFDLSLSPW